MPALARLAAVLASAAAPAASLAQQQGQAAPRTGFAWLWILVAALVVVALLRVLIGPGRRDRPHPPARRPGA